VFGLALAAGRGEFLQLLFAHGFFHRARGTLEFLLGGFAPLCRECGSGGFLLGGLFRWHFWSPGSFPTLNVQAGTAFRQERRTLRQFA
jgi:hypothetical protein